MKWLVAVLTAVFAWTAFPHADAADAVRIGVIFPLTGNAAAQYAGPAVVLSIILAGIAFYLVVGLKHL